MNVVRYTLALLLAFIAFNAFGGGVYGMAGAEGVPTEWLAGSPFRSYLVPSAILFVLVGGACLGAAIAIYADAPHARIAAAAAAAIVATWIGAQIAIIGLVSWLQPVTLVAALAVALMTWKLTRARAPFADRPLAPAGRAGSRVRGGSMRVLVTWGSARGGTEELARLLADGLRRDGIEVFPLSAEAIVSVHNFDAVIVGGPLYMNRWHRHARRFVRRHASELCARPVWFFSSRPLDGTTDDKDTPPTTQVATLMRRIGARGHVTFGGREPARVRAWADELAMTLPTARPGVASRPEPHLRSRLLSYVVVAAPPREDGRR